VDKDQCLRILFEDTVASNQHLHMYVAGRVQGDASSIVIHNLNLSDAISNDVEEYPLTRTDTPRAQATRA
jgi:hypothetical protein